MNNIQYRMALKTARAYLSLAQSMRSSYYLGMARNILSHASTYQPQDLTVFINKGVNNASN